MHLIPIISFKLGHVSIPKRRTFPPLFLFCAYDSSVLQNFKIFTHVLLHFSYSTLPLTGVEFESWVECNYFNDRTRKIRKTISDFILQPSGKFNYVNDRANENLKILDNIDTNKLISEKKK